MHSARLKAQEAGNQGAHLNFSSEKIRRYGLALLCARKVELGDAKDLHSNVWDQRSCNRKCTHRFRMRSKLHTWVLRSAKPMVQQMRLRAFATVWRARSSRNKMRLMTIASTLNTPATYLAVPWTTNKGTQGLNPDPECLRSTFTLWHYAVCEIMWQCERAAMSSRWIQGACPVMDWTRRSKAAQDCSQTRAECCK